MELRGVNDSLFLALVCFLRIQNCDRIGSVRRHIGDCGHGLDILGLAIGKNLLNLLRGDIISVLHLLLGDLLGELVVGDPARLVAFVFGEAAAGVVAAGVEGHGVVLLVVAFLRAF